MDVPNNASFETKKQMRGSLVVGGHASSGRGGSKERTDLFMDSTRMLRYHMLRHTSRMESEIFNDLVSGLVSGGVLSQFLILWNMCSAFFAWPDDVLVTTSLFLSRWLVLSL